MATEAQTKANKANSKRSTGPTSEGGKKVSRFNALKHGYYAKVVCLPGESQEEWQELLTNSLQEHEAEGLTQYLCVAQAAQAEFRLAHLHDFEIVCCEKNPECMNPDLSNHTQNEERWLYMRESQCHRRQLHWIRVRDKNLAQLRLIKKDEANAEKRANKQAHAPIPAAVEEPLVQNESSPGTASDNEAELERQRQIREESEKFYQEMAGKGWSEDDLGTLLTTYLKIKGLTADPPEPAVN